MAQLLNTTSCGDGSREGVGNGALIRERLGGGVNPGEMHGVTRCQNHQTPEMFRLWVTLEAPVARFRSPRSRSLRLCRSGVRSNGRDQPPARPWEEPVLPAVAKPCVAIHGSEVRDGVQGGGAAIAPPNCGFSASFSAFAASSQPWGSRGAGGLETSRRPKQGKLGFWD